MTSRMHLLGFRERFCLLLRARCSRPNRDWHKSCTCMRCKVVRLFACPFSFARVCVRLGASVGSRNPVRKRVDACGLGGRAWMAPCHLRVGSCVTCRPGYLVLGCINLWEEP